MCVLFVGVLKSVCIVCWSIKRCVYCLLEYYKVCIVCWSINPLAAVSAYLRISEGPLQNNS